MKKENKKPLIIEEKEIDVGLLINHCNIHGDILILNSLIDGEIKVGFTIVNASKKPRHVLEIQSMKIKNPISKIRKLLGGKND